MNIERCCCCGMTFDHDICRSTCPHTPFDPIDDDRRVGSLDEGEDEHDAAETP